MRNGEQTRQEIIRKAAPIFKPERLRRGGLVPPHAGDGS